MKRILSSLNSGLCFGLIFCMSVFASLHTAMGAGKSHGLSTFGELKYSADFKHFEYVNPKAPKGGRISMIGPAGTITFDSFNGYILKGNPAQGLDVLFDSLMVRAWDEADAHYGLVAHSVELADDKRSVKFYMRPEAKFSDGSPLTAEDVVFSLDILKTKGHPNYRFPLKDVVKAVALDKYTVEYEFKGSNIRDLPRIVATLPIFSKAFYTKHEFDTVSLKAPLGSGPYKIGKFTQGITLSFERREDYWAEDLPVNVGRYNFGELRYDYFRDRGVEFEALKSGVIDLREEFTSKVWATQYNFKAIKDGRVIREVLPDGRPSGAQGFFLNTRRPHLKDVRVRKALGLVFDFEWTNKNLFYSLYIRTHSYFENSDFKASGLPTKEELAILEPFKAQLPPEVFTEEPYSPPKSNGSGRDRKLFRQASALLKEAGWIVKVSKRVYGGDDPKIKKGEQLKLEFLARDPTSVRLMLPYVKNLKLLGVNATVRRVDAAQYQERMKSFDFDTTIQRYVMGLTPGIGLRNYFHSETAGLNGSYNLSGISNPAIDALVDRVIQSKSRKELIITIKALDRVLRAGHYWTPHWYKASHTLAYWNKFSKPKIKPAYQRGVIETWWYDPDKAGKK